MLLKATDCPPCPVTVQRQKIVLSKYDIEVSSPDCLWKQRRYRKGELIPLTKINNGFTEQPAYREVLPPLLEYVTINNKCSSLKVLLVQIFDLFLSHGSNRL